MRRTRRRSRDDPGRAAQRRRLELPRRPVAGTDSDIDTTSLAVQALVAGGAADTTRRCSKALGYLAAQHRAERCVGRRSVPTTRTRPRWRSSPSTAAGFDVTSSCWRDTAVPNATGTAYGDPVAWICAASSRPTVASRARTTASASTRSRRRRRWRDSCAVWLPVARASGAPDCSTVVAGRRTRRPVSLPRRLVAAAVVTSRRASRAEAVRFRRLGSVPPTPSWPRRSPLRSSARCRARRQPVSSRLTYRSRGRQPRGRRRSTPGAGCTGSSSASAGRSPDCRRCSSRERTRRPRATPARARRCAPLDGVGHEASASDVPRHSRRPALLDVLQVAGRLGFDGRTRAGCACTSVVHDGDVEGWRFGTGQSPPYSSFCAVAGCAPRPHRLRHPRRRPRRPPAARDHRLRRSRGPRRTRRQWVAAQTARRAAGPVRPVPPRRRPPSRATDRPRRRAPRRRRARRRTSGRGAGRVTSRRPGSARTAEATTADPLGRGRRGDPRGRARVRRMVAAPQPRAPRGSARLNATAGEHGSFRFDPPASLGSRTSPRVWTTERPEPR